jgi:hypothetical protein
VTADVAVTADGAVTADVAVTPDVRGLFQRRVSGDDAILRLTRLRFAQAGMPAEIYAGSLAEAQHVLGFVPPHRTLPTVHLDRGIDLLDGDARAAVRVFVDGLGERVYGLVTHDKRSMVQRLPELADALREVGDRDGGPYVFLEYAAGAPLDWFVEVARLAAQVPRAGVCVDVGHVGLAEVSRRLAVTLPPASAEHRAVVRADAAGFEALVPLVEQAITESVPAVLNLFAELGALGVAVHVHLHDGHPAIRGLSDHFTFLNRVPVPFAVDGVRSLPPLYGPAGLEALLRAAVTHVAPQLLSLTLEIHQGEGRLPLDDEAAGLFSHWRDRTNAERANHLLSVIAANHVLATSYLARLPDALAVPAAAAI